MRIELGSDWFKNSSEEWVIPGLLCDSLTLISGEPKAGKTSLACHIVRALIQNSEILGRLPTKQQSTVAWMGFDLNWDRELKARLPDVIHQIFLVGPVHSSERKEWGDVMQSLKDRGVTLLVIDHLYGLGAGEELDKQFQVQNVLSPIAFMCRNLGISVLLLTQASRTGSGRAAHSVAIEGMARSLIRIRGGSGKTRTIETLGNNSASENLKVRLNPNELVLISSKDEANKEKKQADGILPDRARFILKNAPIEVRFSPKELGHWLATQGIGINTADAGRAAVYYLLKADLLSRDEATGEITMGKNLIMRLTAV